MPTCALLARGCGLCPLQGQPPFLIKDAVITAVLWPLPVRFWGNFQATAWLLSASMLTSVSSLPRELNGNNITRIHKNDFSGLKQLRVL